MATVVLVSVLLAGPAQAETADEARARADAAAQVVERLQPRVDAALAAYEASLGGLARDVTASISATREADRAAQVEDAATRAAGQRLRAIYMSGGQTGLLATVLDAQSPSDLALRIGAVGRVVAADRQVVEGASEVTDGAFRVAQARQEAADARTGTVGDTEARFQDLTDLLDEAQAVLSALDANARGLETAERAAAALAAAREAATSAQWVTANTATARGIPVTFLALYRAAAATCPGLPWPVLAAIGQVETGHGTNPNDSSAGAQGPMQFLPSTFAAYAVDGDGDGSADIRNPADAIFSAAKYVCANGAGHSDAGLRRAIFRYNHANWYVALVLRIGAQIADRFGEPPVAAYAPVV